MKDLINISMDLFLKNGLKVEKMISFVELDK